MLHKLQRFIKRLKSKLGTIHPRDGDIWLVSYPKSGSTWIRLILANYIWKNPRIENLRDLQRYVPDIYYDSAGVRAKKFLNERRIIKSHEPYNKSYRQVIYIYRQPFDCAWSYYKFIKDWTKQYESFQAFLPAFIEGDLPYSSWSSHVLDWYRYSHAETIFVSYEDLVKNSWKTMKHITEFMSLNYDEQLLQQALANASPKLVSKVTNDKKFYGKEFNHFVRTPFGIDIEEREVLRRKYSDVFVSMNALYDLVRDGQHV